MTGSSKIGIVYSERPPQLSTGDCPAGSSCGVESFHESAVLNGPILPSRDFLAVFFPLEHKSVEVVRHLSNVFPGAELVAYRVCESEEERLVRGDDGRLAAALPMPAYLTAYLFQNLLDARLKQRELVSARKQVDEIQDILRAFANSVESATDAADRRLGMSLLINKILSYVRAEECILYLRSEEHGMLHRACSTGNLKEIDLFEQNANNSIVEMVLEDGEPYLDNACSYELKVPFSHESVCIRSILCYPVVRRGEKIGVLELLNKDGECFTSEDRAMIEMLLDPLAVAVKTVNIFENSDRLTITDDLTGLYNYRYLMRYLESDVKRCLRYKKKVSLLFIDIDGFKRINDTFGHLVGSQALAEIGQVFKRIVRETDVVSRYGGDEFVIVLPETPLNGAMIIAERIRKKVEECEFVAQGSSVRLTVSVGVANCPKHTLTAEGLIKKADAAMYRAKELSKNSIKVAV